MKSKFIRRAMRKGLRQIREEIRGLTWFFEDLTKYRSLAGAERIEAENLYPCVLDKTATTDFDRHYVYQDRWAFQNVLKNSPKHHVDVGSRIDIIAFLTTITPVTFIDIRPLSADFEQLDSRKGSILAMPYADNSVESLSCLHVAEHIGLGRYGDPLNPSGTKMAIKELTRILAPGGNLYFSLPVGTPRLCFNAHRIHSPKQILDEFSSLELVEFSGVDDSGAYKRNRRVEDLENSRYACGMFWFRKSEKLG